MEAHNVDTPVSAACVRFEVCVEGRYSCSGLVLQQDDCQTTAVVSLLKYFISDCIGQYDAFLLIYVSISHMRSLRIKLWSLYVSQYKQTCKICMACRTMCRSLQRSWRQGQTGGTKRHSSSWRATSLNAYAAPFFSDMCHAQIHLLNPSIAVNHKCCPCLFA